MYRTKFVDSWFH